MKILYSLFKKLLTLFLCLILIKSTIIFAAPEDTDKSVNMSSEEMEEIKELFETKKMREKLEYFLFIIDNFLLYC